MTSALARIGSFAARRRWIVLAGWLLVAGVLITLGRVAGGGFSDDFGVPGADSQQATDLTRTHFDGGGVVSADAVFQVSSGSVRDPGPARAIAGMLAEVARQPYVTVAVDPVAAGTVSADGRTALATVQYNGPADEIGPAALRRLKAAARPVRQAGVTVEFRGWVVEAATRPESGTAEVVGLIAAAVVLLVAFGSLVAAALPLVTAIVGLVTGAALVLLVGAVVDIPSAAPIVAVMLGLGAGIDYALFVVTRFRQYLAEGLDVPAAAAKANATAGVAILFAGGTVVVAILGLNAAGIPFVGAMGLASALVVAVMVLAAVTLLPALLGLAGTKVNSVALPGLGRNRRRSPSTAPSLSRWLRWAEHVRRHRWAYAIGGTVLLLALTAPLLTLRLGMPDDGIQPPSSTQRRAYDLIATSFGAGYNGPLLVAVEAAPADPAALDRLAVAVRADPAVAAVTPPRTSLDETAALFTIIPKTAPQDTATSDLVHRLRDRVLPAALAGTGAQAHVGGRTALMIDMADRVTARLPWVIGGVVASSFLLLVLLFRSVLVPLKAALLTLLSIGVAYGVIVAVFQWGWGVTLLGVDKPVPIMSVVPMFLFAVLFGLSMDYEVFLLSRIREDYLATGDPDTSVSTGLAATGPVITSAATIMAVVFLSFVAIANPLVKMVGIGLSVAVLVDATIIRVILVPALMSLLGRANWWFPGRRPPTRPVTGSLTVTAPTPTRIP